MVPTLLQGYIDAGRGTNTINLAMADYEHYSSYESVEGIECNLEVAIKCFMGSEPSQVIPDDILPLLCEIATKTKHKLKFNDEYLG
ncbi:hypothetical protein GGH91_005073, partial [Coemansia sp. RSA 2671]